jgi:hypothetical protein
MKTKITTSVRLGMAAGLLAAGLLAVNLSAAEQPDAIKRSVVEINKAPQDVFFSPTWEAAKAWGEPAVNFHNGMFTMIYDYFPTPLPFGLATSADGVYWRDAGPVFEKDADVKDIECAFVHRFQPDGPWVMQYAFTTKTTWFRMRFAVSDDLIHWKKLGAESDFVPDPRWYSPKGRWDTIVPCAKDDGTHYGAWDGDPVEGSGFGFGTTTDGIHWNVLPPVRLMVPQATPGCAGELGGFFKIGDRYYISFSRMTLLSRDEFTAVSERPEGPYHPTPKNHYRIEDPFVYARCYNLPGGIYSAEMIWMMRDGKRSYHFPLLKKVEREGESLWLKWWQGNEKLKSRPVALAAPAANKQIEGCRRFDVPETLDLSKGTVIEGTIRLPGRSAARKNFALAAIATATSTKKDVNRTTGGFEAPNAVDGDPATLWLADVTEGQQAQLQLDLGKAKSIGHIRIKGHKINSVELSADGQAWEVCSGGVDSGPSREGAPYRYYDDLSAKARYVRIAVSSIKNARPLSPAGITDICICEQPYESAGRADSGNVGLVLQRTGATDYAVLISSDGTVKFGVICKDGKRFRSVHERNIDVNFGSKAEFRLILRADMGEFYLNDYQISLMNLGGPDRLTGRISFFGFDADCPVRDIKAWNSDPTYGGQK